jgi:uncharacterized membrane protein
MVLLLVVGLLNLIGVVVCHDVARIRGSDKVVFWTMMGMLFGPFAIPMVLHATRVNSSPENALR